MSASGRVLDELARSGEGSMRFLGASGQLGYGIPTPAFQEGLARKPHMIGCDMGSIDIGPHYLGSGQLATAPAATRRDLRKVLLGARQLDVPLVIGSAGSAGAAEHLRQTCAMIRDIAREEGLKLRMAVIPADIDRETLKTAINANSVVPVDGMPDLTIEEVEAASNIVGQMGMASVASALAEDVDLVVTGRACDTAIFAGLATMAGFPAGLAVHMAKIIECASLCCVPGGRDAILATLDHEGFELESMAPHRRATPISVAAHSLYEQSDPFIVHEPEGHLDLSNASYVALDDRRTRVSGAVWHSSTEHYVKIEGSRPIGERALLLAGTADPRFIARHRQTFDELDQVVRDLVCEDSEQDYRIIWRCYGADGVRMFGAPEERLPHEALIMAECIAPTRERAAEVVRTAKQYLLHHGYPERLSTGGNVAFPFTPPEVSVGPAYRFNVYHLMPAHDMHAMFPVEIETI